MSVRENFALICNDLFSNDCEKISLKELCLNAIVQEFQKFYFAFTASNDETYKWFLTFLKRNYSSELLSKLFDTKKLKYEYSSLLINEHLKIFNRSWFIRGPCSIYKDKIFSLLPNLKTIYFCKLCNDKDLQSVAEFCPKLEELHMFYSFVTDSGLKCLWQRKEDGTFPCPNLRIISWEGTCITKDGIKSLIRNLPSLEKIKHNDVPPVLCSIYEEDILTLRRVQSYNLLYLNLHHIREFWNHKNILKACLAVCSRLKSVKCIIYEKEQLDLFTSTNLEDVQLCMAQQISVSNFFKIKRCNLVTLEIRNCIVSISELAICCPELKILLLMNVKLEDDTIDSQPFFHNLAYCYFEYSGDGDLTNKAIRLILSSPKLESVQFYSRDHILSSDSKTDILKYCENHLVKQALFGCTIFDAYFIKQFLLCCPSLISVTLNSSYVHLPEFREIYELLEKLPTQPKFI